MAKVEDPAALRSRWHEVAGVDLPLDSGSVFRETDGYFARRANEKRAKLLAALAPLLRTMLDPGEAVLAAARGYLYSAAEYLLSGHLAALHTNQVALVLTGRRLLWIQVDGKGRPRDLKNQLRVEKVRKATSRWSGQLIVETVAREKLVFNSVPRADRNALVALLPGAPAAPREKEKSVEHLCPACVRVVPGPVGTASRCPWPECRIPFRSPKRAAWLSAIVPGVGDVYLRHFAFGALEFVGSIAVLCVAIFAGLLALGSPRAENVATAAVLAVLFVVLPRVFDFALTLHMGRKGIVPLSLAPVPAGLDEGAPIGPSRSRSLPAFPAWALALFAAGGLAVAATAWFSWAEAKNQGLLFEACRLAETGKIADATKLYDAIGARSPVSPTDRGRFALALWNGGDLDGGDRLVESLGPIEKGVADELNGFVARYGKAREQLEAGRKDLIAGRDAEAWKAIDPALALFRTLETAPLPKSRHDVAVELAGELLGPPLSPEDLDAAVRVAGLASGLPGGDARLDVARFRIAAARGDGAEAGTLAARIDPARLDALWRVLLLEGRFALAGDDVAASVEAREAEAIVPAEIIRLDAGVRANARARRGALLLLAGRDDAVAGADLEKAREFAEDEGRARAEARSDGDAR
jgi:hypothetical protein